MQWIHMDYLLVLGVIKMVKITMLDGICLITLKEDQGVVALLLVICFSMFLW